MTIPAKTIWVLVRCHCAAITPTMRFNQTTIGARAAVRPAPIVEIGGGFEHIDAGVSDGADPALPSIGEVFDEQSAPGLTHQPDYLR